MPYKPRKYNKYISHGNGNILPRFQQVSKCCIPKSDNEKKSFECVSGITMIKLFKEATG
jgi:hypothetical protein